MIQLNSKVAMAAMLTHIHGLMTQAERTDVHAFLHLTNQYARLYCLKLRMLK